MAGVHAATLVYVADPMCSWCWGFAPVIARLAARHAGELGFQLLLGGLRPYTKEPMRQKDKDFIRSHWQHVSEHTGQPFDFGFFDREGFTYDTEPASRAVVTARSMRPGSELAMLHAVQHAFYAQNQDVTDSDTLTLVAGQLGLPPREFADRFASDALREATRTDFVTAHAAGLTGFPTLLVGAPGRGLRVVTEGYQDETGIERSLAAARADLTKSGNPSTN